MEANILQTVGQIAGIAGIGFGVLLIVYRDLIRKDIFPKLSATHAYRVIRLLLVLTWSMALAGIAAWLYSVALSGSPAKRPESVAVIGGSDRLPYQSPDTVKIRSELTEGEVDSLLVDPRPRPFSMVCRKKAILNYDQDYAAALSLLPGPTNDFREMSVYVRSLPNGVLYAHSNFITPGYEHPTKLASNDPTIDLDVIALNMAFAASPSASQKRDLVTAVHTSISFFLDEGLFSKTGRLAIPTNGASKLFVVSGGHLETLDRWKAHTFPEILQGATNAREDSQ